MNYAHLNSMCQLQSEACELAIIKATNQERPQIVVRSMSELYKVDQMCTYLCLLINDVFLPALKGIIIAL